MPDLTSETGTFVPAPGASANTRVNEPSGPVSAEAIGLRYNVALRIEGYNISRGKPVSIEIFRSEGTE